MALFDPVAQVAAMSSFARDCLDGLSRTPKILPCKWLYDDVGSQWFERITALPEYYPTRTEERLLTDAATAIAAGLADGTTLVELGSGASRKTRLLLDAASAITAYAPIDISADELGRAHAVLRADYPRLDVRPLCADFTDPGGLDLDRFGGPMLLFFPGSTLGNMAPDRATAFLSELREAAGAEARLLLGVDLLKDAPTLCAAYDDPAGVTAAFNRNLLARMKRELGAEVDVDAFEHRAIWNAHERRIEMHLIAWTRQEIVLQGRRFVLEAGETIHTENSYKLSPVGWHAVFAGAGWRVAAEWRSGDPSFLLALLA